MDARANTSRLLWFSMGCVSGAIGGYLSVMGCVSGAATPKSIGLILAGGLISVAPQLMIPVGNAPPPTDRLIGKSPEFVEIYVFSYKEEKQKLKKWSAVGWLLGFPTGVLIPLSEL